MKIGIFTDTHGNFLALSAITKFFAEQNCDEVVHCGDMITMGGQSKECLDCFFSSKITLIKGNHDINYVENLSMQRKDSHVSEEHKKFVFSSIGEQYKLKIAALPLTVYRNYFGLKVAFMHYALNPNPKFVYIPINQQPDVALFDEAFAFANADVIFFGHKHEPCDMTGKKRYIDIGSVGCHKDSCANGIILEVDKNGHYSVNRISVKYDRYQTYEIMKQRQVPDCEQIFDYYFKESQNKI